jgi:hypothetical protein
MKKMGFAIDVISNEKLTNIAPVDYRHVCIEGETGSGKTVSCIYPNIKERIKKGHGILVPIYKGHEDRVIKAMAKEYDRLEDIYEIGKPTGVKINLLAIINMELFKDHLKRNYRSSDPYWINTVTSWLLALQKSLWAMKLTLDELKKENIIEEERLQELATIKVPIDYDQKSKKDIIYLTQNYNLMSEPTFASMEVLTKNPITFSQFLKIFKKQMEEIVEEIKSAIKEIDAPKFVLQRCFLFAKKLEEEFEPLVGLNFEKSNSNGGNNGVLEMLKNIIGQFAAYDFFNEGEVDIVDLLEKGKIVVVDLELLSESAITTLYDSIAERLVHRAKEAKELIPISIFIDEANKVLPSNIDLYNDVFRESKVELFISYQSEEQMIEKFGSHKWRAFKDNFLHHYHITKVGNKHLLTYNELNADIEDVVIFEPQELWNADGEFYMLKENRNRILDNFIFKQLPKKFSISYKAVEFQKEQKVWAIDIDNGRGYELFYVRKGKLEEFDDLYSQNEFAKKQEEEIKLNLDFLDSYYGYGDIDMYEDGSIDEMFERMCKEEEYEDYVYDDGDYEEYEEVYENEFYENDVFSEEVYEEIAKTNEEKKEENSKAKIAKVDFNELMRRLLGDDWKEDENDK